MRRARTPRPQGRAPLRALAASAFLLASLVSGGAHARRTGIIAPECGGCHTDGGAQVEVTASPTAFAPGDDVTFTVTVRRMSGTAAVGGVSISVPATGELHTIAGEGMTLVPEAGLTHSQPKQAVGGVVTFRFGWRAPAQPGGIAFDVGAVAGDGNNRSTGDVTGTARFLAVFGCEPVVLYADLDRDGHGSPLYETSLGCADAPPPEFYSTLSDDCNDNDQLVSPSAVEKCNRKDDDCDGEVDEDAELVELWPDTDGDGYYQTKTGTPVIGCSGMQGYAAEPGDCAPNDPAVHAGATETCNLIDDNCDGRIDERLRPQCGVGRCRRESYDCDPAHCMPGEPMPERCNYLDDDCNGEIDDGDLCDPGSACLAGKCVVLTEGVGGGAGAPATGTGGQAAAGGAAGAGGSDVTPAGGVAGASGAAPSAAGGAAGSSESGTTGSGSAGGTPARQPDVTDTSSSCSFGIRDSKNLSFASALFAFLAMLLHVRRRSAP